MDHPKRRTRPSVGFVLLIFALVAGISLGATAALPLGHSGAASGAAAVAPTAPATPTASAVSHSSSHAPAAYPVDAYLRVFNAVPDSPAFDIYLNATLSIVNVAYPTATGYDPLFPGEWNVTVYPTGAPQKPANLTYQVDVTIAAGDYYTLALVGNMSTISSTLLPDTVPLPAANSFEVRFFNAGINATPASDIVATNPITGATNFTLGPEPFLGFSAYKGESNQSVNVTDTFDYNSAVQLFYNNTAFTTNGYTIALVGLSNNTTAMGPQLVFLLDANYTGTPTTTHPVVTVATQLTPLNTYTTLPVNFLFSLSTTNASIYTTNTLLWLNITDFATSSVCDSFNLAGSVYNVTGSMVPYLSVPTWGTTATATWGITLTAAMVANTTACPDFASDPMIVSVAGVVTDPINGTSVSSTSQQTSFVYVPTTSMLHATNTPAAPTTFTIYANYTGQYVGRVQLSVYNPVNGLVTFSANLAWTGTTPTTATWIETVPGAYPYTLSVYTAVGVSNTSGVINVLPSGSTYYNSTTWVNSTLISGLSSSAAGTILLIVGLLIGMIVAMVVGRMVWGGPKTVPPAQPWAQQPAAAANTCSVCGKSFGTPDELAAHSKSEHGMQ